MKHKKLFIFVLATAVLTLSFLIYKELQIDSGRPLISNNRGVIDLEEKQLCENTGGTYYPCHPCPEDRVCETCVPCLCSQEMSFDFSEGCKLDS